MGLISSAAEVNTLAEAVADAGGVYFVTAFSGLLAPYWDPGAAGLLIGQFSFVFFKNAIAPNRTPQEYRSIRTRNTFHARCWRQTHSRHERSSRA